MAFLTSDSKQELYYLLGFLNSKTIFWYFKQIGHLYSDKGFLLSNQYLERFPIPKITKENQNLVDELVKLVNQILALKAENSSADTSQLECDIDDLVFKLYDLNETDISKIKF